MSNPYESPQYIPEGKKRRFPFDLFMGTITNWGALATIGLVSEGIFTLWIGYTLVVSLITISTYYNFMFMRKYL